MLANGLQHERYGVVYSPSLIKGSLMELAYGHTIGAIDYAYKFLILSTISQTLRYAF